MALYAFDGTWNENQPEDSKDTNIVKFADIYKGKVSYIEGVGTRAGWLGRFVGGLTGAGGKRRIREAMQALEQNYEGGDHTIDVIGFSRGAALALEFVNEIASKGVSGLKPVVRFVGLWDVVPSFGIPGNDINLGYILTLPENVQKCFHAMALDERRRNFKVQRVETTMRDANAAGRVFEVWFRGVHSDVGGGNRNTGLSSISLHWMLKAAKRTGLPLADAEIEKQKLFMNPHAPVSKNFDIVPDPYRTVRWNDVGHHSVDERADANNLPRGLARVNDDGNPV